MTIRETRGIYDYSIRCGGDGTCGKASKCNDAMIQTLHLNQSPFHAFAVSKHARYEDLPNS